MANKKKGNYITEILHHDISWYTDSPSVKELDMVSTEHIENAIQEGFSSGDVCMSYGHMGNEEARGMWHIINWRNIAHELYNALLNGNEEDGLKALKKFEDEWTF
jgi:hypothetical protein